jgi:phosphopantetheinyl transferase
LVVAEHGEWDLISELSEQERTLMRTVPDQRRTQFAAGRIAAHAALRMLAGSESACHVGRAPNGAPRFPVGICGSISHCADQSVALACSADHVIGVGVDLALRSGLRSGSERFLYATQAERDRLHARAGRDHTAVALAAKEAVIKALGSLAISGARTGVELAHECAKPVAGRWPADHTVVWSALRSRHYVLGLAFVLVASAGAGPRRDRG